MVKVVTSVESRTLVQPSATNGQRRTVSSDSCDFSASSTATGDPGLISSLQGLASKPELVVSAVLGVNSPGIWVVNRFSKIILGVQGGQAFPPPSTPSVTTSDLDLGLLLSKKRVK